MMYNIIKIIITNTMIRRLNGLWYRTDYITLKKAIMFMCLTDTKTRNFLPLTKAYLEHKNE